MRSQQSLLLVFILKITNRKNAKLLQTIEKGIHYLPLKSYIYIS